ncbi:hypothetical protein ACJJTC_007689 [Scirpophaga incertulas]
MGCLEHNGPRFVESHVQAQEADASDHQRGGDRRTIGNFAIKIKNSVAAAKVIDQYDYIRSPEMLSAVLSKCPQALLSKWADYVFTFNDYKKAKLELFAEFIHSEALKVAEAGVSNIVTTSAAELGRQFDRRNMQRMRPVLHHHENIYSDKKKKKKKKKKNGGHNAPAKSRQPPKTSL